MICYTTCHLYSLCKSIRFQSVNSYNETQYNSSETHFQAEKSKEHSIIDTLKYTTKFRLMVKLTLTISLQSLLKTR